VPSPKVATYDLKPEMSAADIRDKIIPELEKKEADFICFEFCQPGTWWAIPEFFSAVVKACETVDQCNEAVNRSSQKEWILNHNHC